MINLKDVDLLIVGAEYHPAVFLAASVVARGFRPSVLPFSSSVDLDFEGVEDLKGVRSVLILGLTEPDIWVRGLAPKLAPLAALDHPPKVTILGWFSDATVSLIRASLGGCELSIPSPNQASSPARLFKEEIEGETHGVLEAREAELAWDLMELAKRYEDYASSQDDSVRGIQDEMETYKLLFRLCAREASLILHCVQHFSRVLVLSAIMRQELMEYQACLNALLVRARDTSAALFRDAHLDLVETALADGSTELLIVDVENKDFDPESLLKLLAQQARAWVLLGTQPSRYYGMPEKAAIFGAQSGTDEQRMFQVAIGLGLDAWPDDYGLVVPHEDASRMIDEVRKVFSES